jgi:hypothetical protein
MGPGVNLIGQGKFGTILSCSVAGDCILVDHSSTTGGNEFYHSVLPNSKIENFTIQGNGAAGQNVFDFKDAQGVEVHSVFADGASASGSACFLMQNLNWWTERNTFIDVSDGYNCYKGYRFYAPSSSLPSFGYNRFLDIKANTAGAQYAVSFEGHTYMYSGMFHLTINKGGTGSTIWHMQDSAQFYQNELQLMGEENGSGGYFLDLGSGTTLTYTGNVIWGGGTANNIVSGAIYQHFLDSNYSPEFTNIAWNPINVDEINGGAAAGYLTIRPASNTASYAFAIQNYGGSAHYFAICNATSCGGAGYGDYTGPAGFAVGGPTGGGMGAGTINVSGGYYVNGTEVLLNSAKGAAPGTQAVFSGDGNVTESTAGLAGRATCWKAVGKLGYCSSAVGATGACTCD